MEFLESLYSIENFGIYLFVIIGILVVLFLIVLFFGKKDQKKRKELEEKLEQTKITSSDAFKEVPEEVKLDVPKTEEKVLNTENTLENNVINNTDLHNNVESDNNVGLTSNVVLNGDLDNLNEHTNNTVLKEQKKEFDFDALADAISKELSELDQLERTKKDNDSLSEEKIENPVDDKVMDSNVTVNDAVAVKNEYVKPKTVMPSVFSSVYVNREKEEPKPSVTNTPKIELPKMVDLPKKANELNENNDNNRNDNVILP